MEKVDARLPDMMFATFLIEPGARTKAYRRWLRPIADVRSFNGESIYASIVSYHLGQLTIARSRSIAAHYVRTNEIAEEGKLKDFTLVRLLLRGELTARFGDAIVQLKEGDIYVSDLAHSSEVWAQDCAHVNILVPTGSLPDTGVPLHGRVLHNDWLVCRMFKEHLVNFIDALVYADADVVKTMIEVAMVLLHECLHKAPYQPLTLEMAENIRERIVSYIDDHLGDGNLDPNALMRAFRVSRTTLYRLFHDLGGVQRVIRNKRLESAVRDLCNQPKEAISEILLRHGFTTRRQFQRAFRARYGLAAREVRAGYLRIKQP